jgi:hypothetical protein
LADIKDFSRENRERVEIIREYIHRFGVPKGLFRESDIDLTKVFINGLYDGVTNVRNFLASSDTTVEYAKTTPEYEVQMNSLYMAVRASFAGLKKKTLIERVQITGGADRDTLATIILSWHKANKDYETAVRDVKFYEDSAEDLKKKKTPRYEYIQRYEDAKDAKKKIRDGYKDAMDKLRHDGRRLVMKYIVKEESWKEGEDLYRHELGKLKKKVDSKAITLPKYIERKKDLEKFFDEAYDVREDRQKEKQRELPFWKSFGKSEKYGRAKYMRTKFKEEMAAAGSRKERKEIRKKYKPSERSWPARAAGRMSQKTGPMVMKGFLLFAMVGIGALVSAIFGSYLFLLGFIFWGFFYIMPNPDEYKIPDKLNDELDENPLRWSHVSLGMYYRNQNSQWGIIRSILKIGAYGCFIGGLWNNVNVPFLSVVLIAVSFMGYYSLAVEYDPKKSYQLWESIIRFGFLGALFIPWFIFYSLFNSIVLAFIAMAFFAIPPIPNDRKNSELFVRYDFIEKYLFLGFMAAVLVGFLVGWEVPDAMQYTFIYFVIVTGIAGFFSPAQARPGIGFIMLGAASIIYGIGPGQQEMMSTFFGPYWPQIQNSFESITKPIGDAFGSLSETFSNGFFLLTNPVGYATQLMNGTHTTNPYGDSGALGVEITDFTISQIYVGQPYFITGTVMNKGAFNAENVELILSLDEDLAPQKHSNIIHRGEWADRMDASNLGLVTGDGKEACRIEDEKCRIMLEEGKFYTQDMKQEIFSSNGINCTTVNTFDLRKMAIPLEIEVSYGYEVDSKLEVEFISNSEWERLTRLEQLQLRDVTSESSTSPVLLNLGTAGLKNPIKADQAFHIGINLDSDQRDGDIERIEYIEISVPSDFVPQGSCSPGGEDGMKEITDENDIKYYKDSGEDTTIYGIYGLGAAKAKIMFCPFQALGDISSPTKTFIVTAHAKYRFTSQESKSTRLQFGGYCCSEDDCTENQQCCSYGDGAYCIDKDVECEGGALTNNDVTQLEGYCTKRLDSSQYYRSEGFGCLFGMGGCDNPSECAPHGTDILDDDSLWINSGNGLPIMESMACKEIDRYDIKACCYISSSDEYCKSAFERWMSQYNSNPQLRGPPYLYPNMKLIDYEHPSASS